MHEPYRDGIEWRILLAIGLALLAALVVVWDDAIAGAPQAWEAIVALLRVFEGR
jgi:hypothetical protein